MSCVYNYSEWVDLTPRRTQLTALDTFQTVLMNAFRCTALVPRFAHVPPRCTMFVLKWFQVRTSRKTVNSFVPCSSKSLCG